MASLEQFHQRKSHDETDSGPFEASQSGVKHPAQTLAQAIMTLNSRKSVGQTDSFRGKLSESSALLI